MGSKPRVFGVGLSKTGTTSLAAALEILGWDVVDCPQDFELVRSHKAATDSPVAMWLRQGKLKRYRTARYILTVRDLGDWLGSCRQSWQRKPRFSPETDPALHEMRQFFYGSQGFDQWAFVNAYLDHVEAVQAIVPHDRLLIYPLCAGAGWQPLCDFLQVSVPALPFPHLNRS